MQHNSKISFCASIYFIWEFRNDGIFIEAKDNKLKIIKNVEQSAKLNLVDRGIKENNPRKKLIAEIWDLDATWV